MLLSKLHPNERWDLLFHKEPGIETKLCASGVFRVFRHQGRKSGSNDIGDKVPFKFCGAKISAGVKTYIVRLLYCMFFYAYIKVLVNQTQINTHSFNLQL